VRAKQTIDPTQGRLPIGEPYDNKGLFSDYFLKHKLSSMPEWAAGGDYEDARDRVLSIYNKCVRWFGNKTNEPQTERHLIRPILDILWAEHAPGDCYEVQVPIPHAEALGRPDYAFFPHAADRQAATSPQDKRTFFRRVVCIGDAKAWQESLDHQRRPGETFSVQIANYLYRSGVRWGILTNGRKWRLYEREHARSGGGYFEVDLQVILQSGDPKSGDPKGLKWFKWFYLFFRREAFLPDQDGRTFLDKVLEESDTYAAEVRDDIKDAVYDALCRLMNGFCAWPANGLDPHDEATLRLIHENALVVLYRLLFVFFAEDRGLLPCDDGHYKSYSLRRIQQGVNQRLRNNNQPFLPAARSLWDELCNLFCLIDQGCTTADGQVIIPAYNGGLFSPERYPYISRTARPSYSRWDIGDDYLAEVIDRLAYRRARWDQPGTEDIDYATLQVQHLGSIYEGLLEFLPRVADEDLVETVEDGRPVYKPATGGSQPRAVRKQPPRRVAKGQIYLITDRGERKATGSYYTPEYIVNYIVEHTLGPLADEAARQTAQIRKEIDELGKRLKRTTVESNRRKLEQEIREKERRILEPYLSLKILDPAMGSGHFLLGAADFLSLAMATDPSLPPPDTDEDPQMYYKRLVVEHCLYGVDVNPLAVELAKLSLWLHTVSHNRALSFLDHHLRCGNSLLGAWVKEDLMREPPSFSPRRKQAMRPAGQLVLDFTDALISQHLHYFLNIFREIVEAPGGTAEAERKKDRLYREMDSVRNRFRAVANCWIAPYFGVQVTPEQYAEAVNALRYGEDSEEWKTVCSQKWFKAAQCVAKERRFFHWELEFPECFFTSQGLKPKEERGFNAVIGNPPYGAAWTQDERRYLSERLDYLQSGDSAAAFASRALSLARAKAASVGMIVPKGLAFYGQWSDVRSALLQRTRLRALCDAGIAFGDVNYEMLVFAAQTGSAPSSLPTRVDVACPNRRYQESKTIVYTGDASQSLMVKEGVLLLRGFGQRETVLLSRIQDRSVRLREIAADIFRGLYIPDDKKAGLPTGSYRWVDKVPHVGRYEIRCVVEVDLGQQDDWVKQAQRIAVPRVFFKVLRGKRIVCFPDDGRLVTTEKLVNVVLRPESRWSHYAVASIVNTRVPSYYLQRMLFSGATETSRVMDKPYCGPIPLPAIDFAHPTCRRTLEQMRKDCEAALKHRKYSEIRSVVSQTVATHAALYGPGGKPELRDDPYWRSVIATADPNFPGREDFVHDLLAMLAKRMIDLNKRKQEKAHRFLTWLETFAGCAVDDLANKTQIQSFWEHPPDALIDVLKANRRRLKKADPASAQFVNRFLQEYKTATNQVTPILEALTQTDCLIDQIVYMLYGLTDEEIAIIEEST